MIMKKQDRLPDNPKQGDKYYYICPISGVGDDYIFLDGKWHNLGWKSDVEHLAKVKWFA